MPEQKIDYNPGIVKLCDGCQQAALVDPAWISDGKANEEKIAFLGEMGRVRGWTLKIVEGVAEFHCPTCSGGPFQSRAKCPKCGHLKIATHYCVGAEQCAHGMRREHLHRACQRCGYVWLQETHDRDPDRPTEPGLPQHDVHPAPGQPGQATGPQVGMQPATTETSEQ